jgi:hypothetical protein
MSTINVEWIQEASDWVGRNFAPRSRANRVRAEIEQAGEAPEMVQSRDTLEVLRNDDLSLTNWEFLSSWAKINIRVTVGNLDRNNEIEGVRTKQAAGA